MPTRNLRTRLLKNSNQIDTKLSTLIENWGAFILA